MTPIRRAWNTWKEAQRAAEGKESLFLDELGVWAETSHGLDPETSMSTGHECPDSPIDLCVYNVEEDPCRDQCLICGEPWNRQ